MDPRMNEYGGCQPSYQGYGMGQRMNGYDGYQSSSQYGGFGYDVQQDHCVNNQEAYANNQEAYHQGPYTNNQGPYHHQQWNNQEMYHQQQWNTNYQDPYSFSSQYQESSSSSNLCRNELCKMMREEMLKNIRLRETLERLEKVKKQREEDEEVLDVVDEMIQSPNEEEHLAHHKDEERIDEECAKGDSNELTPKTLDLPKVKESLQTLLGSDDLEEFLLKVEHLKFILESKDMLGEVLQEYEEEECSSSSMRTMFKEAPSVERKEINSSKGELQVENMVEIPNGFIQFQPHDEERENLKPLKRAKRRRRRKKPKATKGRGVEPKPPLLTFIPLKVVDGKLECKVRSSNGIKPFAKVKILLSPSSQDNKGGMISEKMARMFNMKLGDYEPRPPYDPPPSHH